MAEKRAAPVSLKRNIAANYAGQAAASLLSLALVPVYIRYLGIEAYALVGLFVVLQAWMALLDLGMTPTLGREMARFTAGSVSVQFIRDLLRTLETLYLGLALLIAVVLAAGSGFLARHWLRVESLPVDVVADALAMLGIVVALRFCEGIYRSGLMALQQQVWVNAVGTLLAVLRSVGALAILAFVSPTVKAFLVWQGLVSLLTLATMGWRLNHSLPAAKRRPRFSREVLIEVRGFAGGVFALSLLGVLLTQVDKLLLSRLLPLTDFGYFMLATTISSLLYMVSWPVAQAINPQLVRWSETVDKTQLAQGYHRASQAMTVLLAPAMLLLTLFPAGVMTAWSGNPELVRNVAPVLRLVALGTGLHALVQLPGLLQLANGWTSLSLRINIVAVVVLLPALFVLVPIGGGVAAAGVWAVLNLGYLLVMIPLMHRRLLRGEMGAWYGRDVALPAAAAALVLVPAAVLAPQLGLGQAGWLCFLALTGALSTVAAALAAPLLRQPITALLAGLPRRVPG